MAKKNYKAPVVKKNRRGRPGRIPMSAPVSEQVRRIFEASGLGITGLQILTRTHPTIESSGVPYQTLWRWVGRKTECTAKTQDRICLALGIVVVKE